VTPSGFSRCRLIEVRAPRLSSYLPLRSCRSVTLVACSRGVLPLVSNQACRFPTESSCVVAGGSTASVSRVAGPMLVNANPVFLKFRDAECGGLVEG
jgi:hypothetical protein